MNLRIRNFAKVKNADIILDGITVIAGKNNTGKSTVGKVLDSMYNSTNNLDTKMKRARKLRLRNILSQKLNYAGNSVHLSPTVITETVNNLFEANDDNEAAYILERLVEYALSDIDIIDNKNFLKELISEYKEIQSIPDEIFTMAILSNYFREMFKGILIIQNIQIQLLR